MKRRKLFIALASLLGSMTLFSTAVFAHTMPSSETTLIRDFSPTLSAEIKPGSTLSQVRDLLGYNYKETVQDFDGFRRVDWEFYKNNFYTVTSIEDTSPHEKLSISGYDITGLTFHTPSGFLPAMTFAEVKQKYGEATMQESADNGNTLHIYVFDDVPRTLAFEVDPNGIIVRISCQSET